MTAKPAWLDTANTLHQSTFRSEVPRQTAMDWENIRLHAQLNILTNQAGIVLTPDQIFDHVGVYLWFLNEWNELDRNLPVNETLYAFTKCDPPIIRVRSDQESLVAIRNSNRDRLEGNGYPIAYSMIPDANLQPKNEEQLGRAVTRLWPLLGSSYSIDEHVKRINDLGISHEKQPQTDNLPFHHFFRLADRRTKGFLSRLELSGVTAAKLKSIGSGVWNIHNALTKEVTNYSDVIDVFEDDAAKFLSQEESIRAAFYAFRDEANIARREYQSGTDVAWATGWNTVAKGSAATRSPVQILQREVNNLLEIFAANEVRQVSLSWKSIIALTENSNWWDALRNENREEMEASVRDLLYEATKNDRSLDYGREKQNIDLKIDLLGCLLGIITYFPNIGSLAKNAEDRKKYLQKYEVIKLLSQRAEQQDKESNE